MSSDSLFTPFIQLRPSDVCIFALYNGSRAPKYDFDSIYDTGAPTDTVQLTHSARPVYSGKFTTSARKRMKTALDVMILMNPARKVFNPIIQKSHTFQFSFITLTYSCSEIVDYKYSILHLEQFLRWLRGTIGARFYVWRLEVQSRGQIHYHIVTECFVRYDSLRDKWNNIQRSAGLILRGENPNSTDIKSAISVSDVSAYCSKYMQKEDKHFENYTGSPIKKFHGCSANLQGVKRPTFNLTECSGSLYDFQTIIAPQYAREFSPSDFSTYYSSLDRRKSKSISLAAFSHFNLKKPFDEWKCAVLAK
jgi:hypothetical protein